jgi:hypothetical protein
MLLNHGFKEHKYETLCNAHNIPNLGVKERDKLHQFHIAGKTLNKNHIFLIAPHPCRKTPHRCLRL